MTMTHPAEAASHRGKDWQSGWWRGAQQCVSPNYGARPPSAAIDLVVLHSISLPPGIYGGNEVRQLFTNTLDWEAHPYFQTIRGMQVSSHFFVTRRGEVWQFVSCEDRAWHAGNSQYRGRNNCNDDSIGIELEGVDNDVFTPLQYASLQTLCTAIADTYAIRHLAGHEHIAPGRKTDPGSGFDWDQLANWPVISDWTFPAQCFKTTDTPTPQTEKK